MSGQSAADQSLSLRLAERLARPPTADDRKRAARHVIDWAGCAVAARAAPAARAMAACFPGDDPRADWPSAAMALGALGNVLEMDDVDKRALLHPGPVVVPAALIAAARTGASDGAMLDAIVRGYEATIRVGRAVGRGHYRFWHNTGTCGPFGAAAAAGSIIGLDTDRLAQALGLAGTQSSGFWQVRHEPESHAKQLHTARATHAGLSAAYLVAGGFVGLRTVLEGAQGFFAATCPDGAPSAVVAEEAGWAIYDVSFKPWPACRHAHAAIDAALAARDDGVEAGDVAAADVETYGDAVVFCDKPYPDDTLSAKFSLQHAAAATLVYGAPGLDRFEGAGLADARTADLRARVAVSVDPEIDARYPARFGARLTIKRRDGSECVYDAPDAFGDPENPMTDADVEHKFRMLADYAAVAPGAVDAAFASVEGPYDGKLLCEQALRLATGQVA
ncbi:MAG: MmgE/PrpD family protein [Pseudomonadota bacterium]